MAPISFIKNSDDFIAELYQNNTGGKIVRIRVKRSGLVLTTNRKDHQRLLGVYENIAKRETDQITYTLSRGLDSLDDQVLVSKSALKQIMNANRKNQILIEED